MNRLLVFGIFTAGCVGCGQEVTIEPGPFNKQDVVEVIEMTFVVADMISDESGTETYNLGFSVEFSRDAKYVNDMCTLPRDQKIGGCALTMSGRRYVYIMVWPEQKCVSQTALSHEILHLVQFYMTPENGHPMPWFARPGTDDVSAEMIASRAIGERGCIEEGQ